MDRLLKPGIELTLAKEVGLNDLASNMGSGSIDVLSTPSLVAFMERTAMESVAGYLGHGESTVGAMINIRHIRPTLAGETIRCTAKLDGIEGKRLSFYIEASGDSGLIGEGRHDRYIIDEAAFMNKLKRPV